MLQCSAGHCCIRLPGRRRAWTNELLKVGSGKGERRRRTVHLRRKKARPVRIGVVGVGQMGRYHVGVLAELPHVELVGIVDVDPKRIQPLAETYNTTGLTDYRDLLGEVDVVSVAVPTALHCEITREFLDAGV